MGKSMNKPVGLVAKLIPFCRDMNIILGADYADYTDSFPVI